MSGQAHEERERSFGAAKLIATLTVVSRVFGMVRDIAITSLGANRAVSAFVFAFKVPNLFRRLFGEGALSAAFVPVFSESSEQEGFERARRLFANAMGLLAAGLSGLTVLIWIGLLGWHALWPGEWDRQLLIELLAIMMPFMITICLLALGSAALNCRGHFAFPAAAPILLNLVIIAAAWTIVPPWRRDPHSITPGELYRLGGAVTLAGVIQLVGVLWMLKRYGFSIRPRLRPIEPGIGQILRLMGPMIVGLGFLQVSELLNDAIAWIFAQREGATTVSLFGHELARPLGSGVLVHVYAAQRLYQFPMGVLAISLAVAVFPLLSRYAARGDNENLRSALNRAVRLSGMEGIAAGVGMFLLAEPITRVIYRHGKFTAADVAVSASILRMYVVGMWAYCTLGVLQRAFYSLKDTVTPLKISCSLVVANLALVAGLIWTPLHERAFGAAMTVTATANSLLLLVLLRRRLGRLGARAMLLSIARAAGCAAVMGGVILLLRWPLERFGALAVVGACVPAGAATFVAAAWVLRAPELGELVSSLRKRGKMVS
ncbi:MAG: putative peptidoglycan biosynthesis protein MurJ [Planctomycetes bacterium ADurb.Bin126]|nr:MAG: putative peptidoglycan biosynthesis protein MurJ [Planctomycetes bacterium ADurb.Bin126]HOD81112.1 murein biosynthesis integral membrane protein MurJ [Phycisphaerae bacterium]HQL72635.1 murein biosynthesis integral membrane protein MurJ [Phycisphaerae bacterium]